MKYTLKNKEIELTNEEVAEIVKQSSQPVEEKKVGIAIKNRWSGEIIFQSTKTTWKEAVEEGKADLREADLYGANLSGADLREADLYEADLREAGLYEADLREADLYGANLRGANLSEADLYGANLREAEMQNAKFYGKTSNPKLLKPNQVDDFLAGLGFKIEK